MYAIETKDLGYRRSAQETILEQIDLKVPFGCIYGFLGPNGAGKTTTLKLVLGLLKKQQGDILVHGKPIAHNRMLLLRRIGALIESPSLYPNLTAAEHLHIIQKIYQCPVSRISEVLQLTGLQDVASKRTSRFSLGMKQRLAIAMALLPNPSLLILDEPTNGLDPQGIIEMRALLKRLNDERDMTILISSHMLAEVEKLVTHIGIINKGRMVFQGTREALQASQQQGVLTHITVSDVQQAVAIAHASGIKATTAADHILIPSADQALIASLNSKLVAASLAVSQIRTQTNDLESVFIDLLNIPHEIH